MQAIQTQVATGALSQSRDEKQMLVMDRREVREDIQALRGVAVLLVLLFHAQLGGLNAGYLGVDVFFVLSGYLIIGLLARRLDEGCFSFADFYLNRAKRLLPAAYVVYGVTAVAACWLLSDSEFSRLLHTLWGALTFSANVTLWLGTSYFAEAAKLNALLHVWSLSVEEQFYLVMPLALFLTPRKYRLSLVVLGGLASLGLCFFFAPKSPVAAFYLLPTRAWELAIGGAIALIEARRGAILPVGAKSLAINFVAGRGLGVLALAVLVMTTAFAPGSLLDSRHPGLDALLVCVATGALLVARPPLLARGAISWPLARLGDMSYSLYLVHWPLFALATNAYLGLTPPLETRLMLLAVALVLAYLLFRFVEEPIHRLPLGKARIRSALTVAAATAAVALLAVGIKASRVSPKNYAELLRPNFGLSDQCDFAERFQPFDACKTKDSPSLLVWGDSFAMHLVPALKPSAESGLVQATMSLCAPVLDLAQFDPHLGVYEKWAMRCMRFNDSVLEYLARTPSIRVVVLSSVFTQFYEADARGLIAKDHEIYSRPFSKADFPDALRETIRKIRALGKQVVVYGPTPSAGADTALCLIRRELGLLTAGPYRNCEMPSRAAIAYRAPITEDLKQVSKLSGATFEDLVGLLCRNDMCRTSVGDTWLFRDGGHFSVEGSERLGLERWIVAPRAE
jgi:peptidoglycan/LPS O-acetylase OafA/YrhL